LLRLLLLLLLVEHVGSLSDLLPVHLVALQGQLLALHRKRVGALPSE